MSLRRTYFIPFLPSFLPSKVSSFCRQKKAKWIEGHKILGTRILVSFWGSILVHSPSLVRSHSSSYKNSCELCHIQVTVQLFTCQLSSSLILVWSREWNNNSQPTLPSAIWNPKPRERSWKCFNISLKNSFRNEALKMREADIVKYRSGDLKYKNRKRRKKSQWLFWASVGSVIKRSKGKMQSLSTV